MAYYLGKDVDVYISTEQRYNAVSGTTTSIASGSGIADAQYAITGSQYGGIFPRSGGISAGAFNTNMKVDDVTGVDLGMGAMDEDISYFGFNTNVNTQIKKEIVVTLTKKRSNGFYDKLFNGARDGIYTTPADGDAAGTFFDGLTSPNNQNFGYRLYVQLKGSAGGELFVVRNSCLTGHSVTLNADGVQEETLEFYSYVNPILVSGAGDYGVEQITSGTAL